MSIKKFNDFSVNENLKSKEDLEKHIEDIFNNSHLSNHTPERQVDEKEGMIKAYDFLTKYFPKIGHVAYERLVEYMWEIWPNEEDIDKRTGMLMTYDYLSGKYDSEQKERERIGKMISDKIKKNYQNK